MDQSKTYEIDRKTASQLLKISIRSVDRYIRAGRLSARQENGRIWLAKEEILNLKRGVNQMSATATADIDTPDIDAPQPLFITQKRDRNPVSTQHNTEFYKDLYQETIKILEDRNRKLEAMQYRIGQLEAQTTRPAGTQTINEDELMTKHRLQASLMENGKIIDRLEEQLQKERLNRSVFTWLLYGILLAQPILWYLLRS